MRTELYTTTRSMFHENTPCSHYERLEAFDACGVQIPAVDVAIPFSDVLGALAKIEGHTRTYEGAEDNAHQGPWESAALAQDALWVLGVIAERLRTFLEVSSLTDALLRRASVPHSYDVGWLGNLRHLSSDTSTEQKLETALSFSLADRHAVLLRIWDRAGLGLAEVQEVYSEWLVSEEDTSGDITVSWNDIFAASGCDAEPHRAALQDAGVHLYYETPDVRRSFLTASRLRDECQIHYQQEPPSGIFAVVHDSIRLLGVAPDKQRAESFANFLAMRLLADAVEPTQLLQRFPVLAGRSPWGLSSAVLARPLPQRLACLEALAIDAKLERSGLHLHYIRWRREFNAPFM